MRSPGAELRKAGSRRGYLHPFKSFSTSRVPRRIQPSPEREEKPKKEGGFFSQLKRSFTLGQRPSSSTAAAPPPPPPPSSSKEGAGAPPWGRRVKNGLSKPLKIVKTSYVDCMMGIAEDPRVEGVGAMGFQNANSQAYAFQASASRHLHSSSGSTGDHDFLHPIDAQLQAALRGSKHHAHIISSE